MRDGAKPLLCWATLLTLSGALNLIWVGVSVQTATFAAGVLAVLSAGLVVLVRAPRQGAEMVTHASFAPVIIAVGFAVLMFGLSFGHFLIYFGAGLMLAGAGRLLVELSYQRRAARGRSR